MFLGTSIRVLLDASWSVLACDGWDRVLGRIDEAKRDDLKWRVGR